MSKNHLQRQFLCKKKIFCKKSFMQKNLGAPFVCEIALPAIWSGQLIQMLTSKDRKTYRKWAWWKVQQFWTSTVSTHQRLLALLTVDCLSSLFQADHLFLYAPAYSYTSYSWDGKFLMNRDCQSSFLGWSAPLPSNCRACFNCQLHYPPKSLYKNSYDYLQ